MAPLVEKYGCGMAIALGEADMLAETLRRWSHEPKTVAQMGERARHMLDSRFTRQHGLKRWKALLDRLIGQRLKLR